MATCHDSGVPRLSSTLLTVCLAAVLALAAYVDVLLVAAAVVVVQLLVATASAPADARGRSIPSPRFTAAVVSGLVATGITLAPTVLNGADGSRSAADVTIASGTLAALLPAIAAGVFVTLAAQMRRRDGRRELVASTGYAVSLGAFAALAVGWIGAAQSSGGADLVGVAAAGLAVGVLVWALPVSRWLRGAMAVLLGTGAGSAVALQLEAVVATSLGAAAGGAAAFFGILGQAIGRAWSQDRPHAAAGWGFPAGLSVALVGPVVYVGGQLVGAHHLF